MSATMILNGRPRRQLSDQLDRLDGILDVLDEGLSGAVVEAVKAGTATAVKEALVEILTNPELLAAIRGVLPTPDSMKADVTIPAPSRPSLWVRLKAKLSHARAAVIAGLSRAKVAAFNWGKAIFAGVSQMARSMRERVGFIQERVAKVVKVIRVFRRVKHVALIAGGIGLATGVMSQVAPQTTAALTSGLTAAITVVGVQLGLRARQFCQRVLPALM